MFQSMPTRLQRTHPLTLHVYASVIQGIVKLWGNRILIMHIIDNIAASADIMISEFTAKWESAKNVSPGTLTKNKVRNIIFRYLDETYR